LSKVDRMENSKMTKDEMIRLLGDRALHERKGRLIAEKKLEVVEKKAREIGEENRHHRRIIDEHIAMNGEGDAMGTLNELDQSDENVLSSLSNKWESYANWLDEYMFGSVDESGFGLL
jgi:hypothetical protein